MTPTAKELATYIGRVLPITDRRTDVSYTLTIADARSKFGRLEVQAVDGRWFEPTATELATAQQPAEVGK